MNALGYAGDVNPEEAWALLEGELEALLVDVRSEPEWRYVGLPDLSALGREVVLVSWQVYPDMEVNADFLAALSAAGIKPEQPLLMICRSGQRSRDAAIALTRAGYERCYNVAEGFEGPLDEVRHRGGAGGWKARGLPWVQS